MRPSNRSGGYPPLAVSAASPHPIDLSDVVRGVTGVAANRRLRGRYRCALLPGGARAGEVPRAYSAVTSFHLSHLSLLPQSPTSSGLSRVAGPVAGRRRIRPDTPACAAPRAPRVAALVGHGPRKKGPELLPQLSLHAPRSPRNARHHGLSRRRAASRATHLHVVCQKPAGIRSFPAAHAPLRAGGHYAAP